MLSTALFFVYTERSRFAGAGLAAFDPPVAYASTRLSALTCKTRPAVRYRSLRSGLVVRRSVGQNARPARGSIEFRLTAVLSETRSVLLSAPGLLHTCSRLLKIPGILKILSIPSPRANNHSSPFATLSPPCLFVGKGRTAYQPPPHAKPLKISQNFPKHLTPRSNCL